MCMTSSCAKSVCVLAGGSVVHTDSQNESSNVVLASICIALGKATKTSANIHVAMAHTAAAGQSNSSSIRATIERIKKETGGETRQQWLLYNPGSKVASYFIAKCDVFSFVFRGSCLVGFGYDLYCVLRCTPGTVGLSAGERSLHSA